MTALYPPKDRHKLGRKYRWAAASLWVLVGIVSLALLGNIAGSGESQFREDLNPVITVFMGLTSAVIVVAVLILLHRRSREWTRAARSDPPPVFVRGTIVEVDRERTGLIRLDSVTTAEIGEQTWRLHSRDRADMSSAPGDLITVELYGTSGRVLGAYRNERTGDVRAIGTKFP